MRCEQRKNKIVLSSCMGLAGSLMLVMWAMPLASAHEGPVRGRDEEKLDIADYIIDTNVPVVYTCPPDNETVKVSGWIGFYISDHQKALVKLTASCGDLETSVNPVSLIIAGFLIYKYDEIPEKSRIFLALIFGGTVGNLIDRVRLGYVVDFLDFFYKNWHFPSFNVADSSIFLGVASIIVVFIIIERKNQVNQK